MTLLHAGCVALEGRGLLILGPSGVGKSALALELMAFGARLIADDQVLLAAEQGRLIARAPDPISGLIEARGVGLLRAVADQQAELVLAVDLGQREPERLPPRRRFHMLGCDLPLVLGAGQGHLGPALLQYIRAGRDA